ncbi:hypothetical protein GGX14DRAFT_567183 [Mycena pura]|uniref:Uncharacterized protein n=1 Tax=Mycena pura TaxID=153505 RepID=A0AAD6Y8W1_9AGAR|nr:hypothetical protein GGX14DRAFT_567183 [Mycena pura]
MQLDLAAEGKMKDIEKRQTASGTKDKITQYWIEKLIQRGAEIRNADPSRSVRDVAQELKMWLTVQPGDKMNPLLDIAGLDPSQDTPVELLHTVLLGVIKYIWHFMNTEKWKDEDRHLLAIRLQSTDLSGLSVPPIRASYMFQYRNNLIGKHFKTLMQTLAFHVDSMASPEELQLIVTAGDLGARLWISVIDDMERHLKQLEIATGNVLDAFDAVDPLRIIVKIKLHLLTHLPTDIRRFGLAIRFSTEIFEAYNAVFRMCSINSNHIAPSRDISQKFASMDRVKHLLSGGYWWNQQSSSWVQAGGAVRQVLVNDPVVQRHLGWVKPEPIIPGAVRVISMRKQPALEWRKTEASKHTWSFGDPPQPNSLWRIGQHVTTVSGDGVPKLGWVFARDVQGQAIFGRVAEILVGKKNIVMLEQFVCGEERHPNLGWPIARRPRGTDITVGNVQTHVVLEASALQFVFSVQHDCRKGKCLPVVIGKQIQERQETTLDRQLIHHTDDDHFIINMAGLHNFVELIRILPKHLTELRYIHADRQQFHIDASTKAMAARTKKRQKTAARRRATAAEKKRQAEEAGAAASRAEKAAAEAEAAVVEDRDIEPSATDDEIEASDTERGGRRSDRSGCGTWDAAESEEEDIGSEDDYVPRGGQGGLKAKKHFPSQSLELKATQLHPKRQGVGSGCVI